MSDQDFTEERTSAEEKFFGIKHTIGKKANEDDEENPIQLELEEEPEAAQPKKETKKETLSDEIDDDELSSYSDKVQKRIKQLSWQKHEERRRREAIEQELQKAQKMREEAVRLAQVASGRNQEYEELIANGEAVLIEQIKGRAALAAQQAEAAYRQAHEEGNTDAMVAAQKALFQAQAETAQAENYTSNYEQRRQQYEQWKAYQQQRAHWMQAQQAQLARQARMQPPKVKPSDAAVKWAEKNADWFNKDRAMTAFAYGKHEQLVRDGVPPDSPEYFDALDEELRSRFPEHFSDGSGSGRKAPSTSRSAPNVVASVSRNNGAKPRKVKLTSTQAALAKRLGLTVEQYAEQYAKELTEGF